MDRTTSRQSAKPHTDAHQPGRLPASGFVRLSQLVPTIIPVSAATWWRWVKSGKAPKPVKLSERVTAWRVEDVRAFLAAQA
jgi:predicted DNA-binding transcriptional regulator AlpA